MKLSELILILQDIKRVSGDPEVVTTDVLYTTDTSNLVDGKYVPQFNVMLSEPVVYMDGNTVRIVSGDLIEIED